jgi:dihydrofolate synthase / folylpolyglutamate synthase
MYQRIGPAAYKKDLGNTIALCAALGNPQNAFKSIHVAGTNGKGSTCHMLASALQENGYKTGLYTSPHLLDFRERIKVDGEMASQEFVCQFVETIRAELETIKPSFFEITVVMSFAWFREQKVDIAIIETGLGGRLDSTNVIIPELSIITNIGYDHTDMLGESLNEIAAEKAGIIKPNVPVIIGEFQAEVFKVFSDKAREFDAKIIRTYLKQPMDFTTDLQGVYQQKNLRTAVTSLNHLQKLGWSLSGEKNQNGLNRVAENTGLNGRWQIMSTKPIVICDTGHNAEGMLDITEQLKNEEYRKLHFVLGMVSGKNSKRVLSLLPKKATYYFCQPKVPRAMDVEELKMKSSEFELEGNIFPSVALAFSSANESSRENDLIFIGGSTFVVADFLSFLKKSENLDFN